MNISFKQNSTLKMEAVVAPESTITSQRFIEEYGILHLNRSEKLNSH